MRDNVGLGIWEIVLLVGTVVMVVVMASNSKQRYYLMAFPVLYLLTQLLWSPLSGGNDLNNAGSTWWLDPWNPLFSITPAFKWWLWALFGLAVATSFVSVLQAVSRRLVYLLLFLGILGIDGLFSFGPTDPWTHIRKQTSVEVSAEFLPCEQLRSKIRQAWKVDNDANALLARIPPGDKRGRDQERIANATADDLNDLRITLHSRRAECVRGPTSAFTAVVQPDGRTVKFDASASTGEGLSYVLYPDDLNHGNPVSQSDGTFTRYYYEPGEHFPVVIVTDLYGDTAEATHRVVTKGPAR